MRLVAYGTIQCCFDCGLQGFRELRVRGAGRFQTLLLGLIRRVCFVSRKIRLPPDLQGQFRQKIR